MSAQLKTNKDECYHLSWKDRIGFGSGDLAQNLIYQTVSIWLLFFYTNVYGLRPEVAALMFFVVRVIDLVWCPTVGVIVDKANPRWGKYRSWLLFAGLPLAVFAALCFWNGFSGSLLYAYITYVGLSMCFTFINVPYSALGASLTRDTHEITVLTSVRMFMANTAGLLIKTLPLLVALFKDPATGWFCSMSVFAAIGFALLVFCFFNSEERIDVTKLSSKNVRPHDLYEELMRNKPLRVLSLFFMIAFITMSISAAADSYFLTYCVGATPLMTTVYMWLGTIPAFIMFPLVPFFKKKFGKNGMFEMFLGLAILMMVLTYIVVRMLGGGASSGDDAAMLQKHFWLLCVFQFLKSSGVLVATGYMWALVPEVVSYGEHISGKRMAGIVNSLVCLFMKAGMALGGVIPGLVLAWVGFEATGEISDSAMVASQPPLVHEGILWLLTLIPASLFFISVLVIHQYELTDDRMQEINSL